MRLIAANHACRLVIPARDTLCERELPPFGMNCKQREFLLSRCVSQAQKQDLAMSKPTVAVPAMTIEVAAALMEPLTDLVVQAGTAVLAVDRGSMRVEGKSDGSPVTEADLAADRILGEGLARLAPDIPTLSEERAQGAKPPFRGSFFLIDPLDGTKEFVAGRPEFTINLALVTNGTPLLGIVGAPALGWLWRGLVGRGAERLRLNAAAGRGVAEPIHTRALP